MFLNENNDLIFKEIKHETAWLKIWMIILVFSIEYAICFVPYASFWINFKLTNF